MVNYAIMIQAIAFVAALFIIVFLLALNQLRRDHDLWRGAHDRKLDSLSSNYQAIIKQLERKVERLQDTGTENGEIEGIPYEVKETKPKD